MHRLSPALLAVAVLSAGPTAALAGASSVSNYANSPAFSGHQFAHQARVTLRAARAIATHVRQGRIADQELEQEHGGSGLRYSFDIKAANKTYEVGVDAVTGKVLENGVESAAAEAAESASESHGN